MTGAERGLLVLPGRGAYVATSLGTLDPAHPWVVEADARRRAAGLATLSELDGAATFEPRRHFQPIHAAPLTWIAALLDAERAATDHHVACVVGNGLGWLTALAASAALDFGDGFAAVQELARLQQAPLPSGGHGGQVIYPLVDGEWHPDPALRTIADAAITGDAGAASDRAGVVHLSADLIGYTTFGGDDAGVERLLRQLPPLRAGGRRYPLRVALQGPDHTPLAGHVAAALRDNLASIAWARPQVTIIDGRGRRWTPWSTDPAALRDYTLGEWLSTPYRFDTAMRVALREEAPDRLILTGPGTALAAVCGQALVAEGYQGIRSRQDFERRQRTDPLVLSMGS